MLLALFVLLAGPTAAILDTFTSTLGRYLSQFVEMSLRLTPFRAESTWVGNWTVFYWAWWISWSPFVGMFIARVSRGRTVREFIISVLIVPTIVSIFWMTAFGGTATGKLAPKNFPRTDLVSTFLTGITSGPTVWTRRGRSPS